MQEFSRIASFAFTDSERQFWMPLVGSICADSLHQMRVDVRRFYPFICLFIHSQSAYERIGRLIDVKWQNIWRRRLNSERNKTKNAFSLNIRLHPIQRFAVSRMTTEGGWNWCFNSNKKKTKWFTYHWCGAGRDFPFTWRSFAFRRRKWISSHYQAETIALIRISGVWQLTVPSLYGIKTNRFVSPDRSHYCYQSEIQFCIHLTFAFSVLFFSLHLASSFSVSNWIRNLVLINHLRTEKRHM